MKENQEIKFYERNINNCREDIINGVQIEKNQVEYNIGKNMYAASNVGRRENQEDSVLILEHQEDKNIKLLAVGDGVGGEENGQQASQYLMKELLIFFESNKAKHYSNLEYIKKALEQKILLINNEIIDKKLGKTTLSMAIITNEATLIVNIGDSRIYTYNENNLNQETRDDSLVQLFYENNIIKEKELRRFHNRSNEITNCIGSYNISINSKVMKTDYEIIIGLTDGVIDCLSEEEIKKVIEVKEGNLAKNLVNKAINNISINTSKFILSGEYQSVIIGGKDNATAGVVKIR